MFNGVLQSVIKGFGGKLNTVLADDRGIKTMSLSFKYSQ